MESRNIDVANQTHELGEGRSGPDRKVESSDPEKDEQAYSRQGRGKNNNLQGLERRSPMNPLPFCG
jgi:hypothetical protein